MCVILKNEPQKENHPGTYIAGQMLDVGGLGYANRTVKIVPVTPLFNWVTLIDAAKLDNSWVPVNEVYNPYHLK